MNEARESSKQNTLREAWKRKKAFTRTAPIRPTWTVTQSPCPLRRPVQRPPRPHHPLANRLRLVSTPAFRSSSRQQQPPIIIWPARPSKKPARSSSRQWICPKLAASRHLNLKAFRQTCPPSPLSTRINASNQMIASRNRRTLSVRCASSI